MREIEALVDMLSNLERQSEVLAERGMPQREVDEAFGRMYRLERDRTGIHSLMADIRARDTSGS